MFVLLPDDCAICFGPHDEVIHEATARVHAWFRRELARRLRRPHDDLQPVPLPPPARAPEAVQ